MRATVVRLLHILHLDVDGKPENHRYVLLHQYFTIVITVDVVIDPDFLD